MSTGYLVIEVYEEDGVTPIPGAFLQIFGENTNLNITTNASGQTEKLSLDAPDIEYSLEPQENVRPYSVYSIKVQKEGYETSIIEGVEVMASETSIQKINLLKGTTGITYEELPPHVLWGDYPPMIDDQINITESVNERVYPRVLIPEYIIVHNGTPSSSATNYVVSFPDYIKNVASSEIYSTWPKETIKANVLAIISFALNRIYTEWYPSRGYNFTITSSTAYDQKYTHGRTIFQSISDVVDEIFNNYIKLPNVSQPFFAQYNDGIKTNNPGWLSQWGSKSLGDSGYDALQIIRYYYNPNMMIMEADNSIGLPYSFPGYNLSMGSCGEEVQILQNQLNKISGNYPAIPKILQPNGVFGEDTQTSVKKFQEVFGLPITGTVNYATWYKISYIFVAVSKMIQGIYG